MCPPCRTRYRTYGITKRAKWKAERAAFDREMIALKKVEDEKRKERGQRPLSECPEELRVWEHSIIDEQASLPMVILPGPSSASNTGVPAPLLTENSTLASQGTVTPGEYPAPVDAQRQEILGAQVVVPSGVNPNAGQVGYFPSAIDTPLSHSPYKHLNNPLTMGSHPPLPARMCTVSHCHKILPGFYRYKRCSKGGRSRRGCRGGVDTPWI
ncbi:hypothetical protein BDQ12DRAFT_459631 [Crucibulum laeve]|uniref:Uncharacterized protein n=1 Tax=Crucibulum laeve TaxID=68775 RepID=A0A5C3MHG0_9AGAR|nr:hypothetical protein BDQ12DRAFT_459631 [Crucibulum laeve]